MANVIHITAPSTGGKKQRKKLIKQEARLMLKVEQARKDVQKAQGKVTKAQAQLDDSQKRLQTVEEKLVALRTSSQEQQSGTNGSESAQSTAQQGTSSATTTGTAWEQGEQSQPAQQGELAQQTQQGEQGEQTPQMQQNQQSEQGEQSQQLPANETYVGGAQDTEQARNPDEARSDVLQGEGQEMSQEHSVATDMAQAQDQGEVSVPPDTQEPNQDSHEEEGHTQPETQQSSELPDQHPFVSSHSQSYLQTDDDEAPTGESELYSSTQY